MTKDKYIKLADKIYKNLVEEARLKGISENFGDREIAKYNDKLNSDDDINYATKAELSHILGEKLRNIEI